MRDDDNSLWKNLEEVQLKDDKIKEFCQLFKRTVVARQCRLKSTKEIKESVSLLDPKRAHTINILVTSRHLGIKDIEKTVYNLDTSIIDVETLKQIHEIAGTDEELQLIENHLSNPDHSELGKAEKFILELSKIDSFENRFKCIMFEVTSSEQLQNIESKLNSFRHMCEMLTTSADIKDVLSIVLALGNYMNGGNRDRGQADGFGLEILPKLKDVKSATSSSLTLLHYVVQTFIQDHIPQNVVSYSDIKKPLPESSDLEQASVVVFDDIEQDLKSLKEELSKCIESCELVEREPEPFKSHMKGIFHMIERGYTDQVENLADCKRIFNETSAYFCWRPKTQQPIREFFLCWIPFCRDFQAIFKNEVLRRIKYELENVKARVNADKKARTKDVKTSKANPHGLKARLTRKGLLNNIISNTFA